MEWNVFYYNINKKQVEIYNALANYEDIIYGFWKENHRIDAFSKRLMNEMKYRYLSRCEYEIGIADYMNPKEIKKIDIFSQLQMNWEHFATYCWWYCKELNEEK